MPNHLINENSPYLLQHAENPVDWYPWSDEALAKANEEDKPIFLSIGYAACHWCHVMAHESFEDVATASLMNEYFVNIKVDREDQPERNAKQRLHVCRRRERRDPRRTSCRRGGAGTGGGVEPGWQTTGLNG